MGAQIGVEYALGGCEVSFLVRVRERAEPRVEQALGLAQVHGLAGEAALARARAAIDWEEGEPELIVESLPEDLSLKAGVLGPLAARHPDAIVATNTSSISIGALGEATGVPERIVGTHYWNPPLLMPLVEVRVLDDSKQPIFIGDRSDSDGRWWRTVSVDLFLCLSVEQAKAEGGTALALFCSRKKPKKSPLPQTEIDRATHKFLSGEDDE